MKVEIQGGNRKHEDIFRPSYVHTVAFYVCRERAEFDHVAGEV
jgi:hypothetical protein